MDLINYLFEYIYPQKELKIYYKEKDQTLRKVAEFYNETDKNKKNIIQRKLFEITWIKKHHQ